MVVMVAGPTAVRARKVERRRWRRRQTRVRILVGVDEHGGLDVEAGMHVVRRRERALHAVRH